jgi:signal transduction histidine kinase
MRTRRSEVIARVDGEMLRSVAQNEENLAILRQLGIGSILAVPLIARGRVLGAITFVGDDQAGGFTEGDRELAEDLAARSALAIDNARLLREAQEARQRAESASLEARAANQAKSQFLAVTSHEIRTPINAIIGYAQLLEMELGGPLTALQREHLERIQASSQHLLGLVNEILDLAKVESGQMTVRREKRRLSAVVQEAKELIHPQALACNLDLPIDARDGEDVEFLGDADRVRQVLVILLTNACKFTDAPGRVRMEYGLASETPGAGRLSGAGPWAWVSVEDAGIGIPADKQESVFEPFIQAEQGLTRREGGTGLGLAIGRQLARMMGGDLTLRSEEGSGSTFTLWLPSPEREARESLATQAAVPEWRVLSGLILQRAEAVVQTYAERLASGERVAAARVAGEMELRDLALNLVTAIAQLLALRADGADPADPAYRDALRILRMVAELHARQRRSMGWSSMDVRGDLQLLREELEQAVRTMEPDSPSLARGLPELDRLFDEAARAGLGAWHDDPI